MDSVCGQPIHPMTIQECIDKWKGERDRMASSLSCFRVYRDYADRFIKDLEEIQKSETPRGWPYTHEPGILPGTRK